ncbi:hypothetical protein [Micromonospora sp. NBRC 107095]|uniref:hypothetical protein n=1 Tax=Micromonospora sp. NBRC 107095 TaxID=3032209 RepID=UPI0024A1CCDE|nr:hypothetical protein [Micromonospora sp. NBRC 107095]GLZ60922.1 hypothetical protein Misp05_44980 [Micromonospora sp. NBRC 107095]
MVTDPDAGGTSTFTDLPRSARIGDDLGALDPEMLEALLRPGNAPHVRFAGYRLLTSADAWQRLATNLRLIDDPDARLCAGARADISV